MIKPGKPVKDISIKKGDTIDTIFDQMSKSGGFESKNLVDGLNILTSMIEDKNCLKFMSFVGAIVSTGLRGVITDMVKNKMCDVIITTCGALDHDIARHYSNYLEGSFTMDDSELMEKEIHRLGNVLVPMKSYGPLIEEKMQNFLQQAYKDGKREMSTRDITKMIGEQLGEGSFLYWASKNNIPVIVPGIMDGAVGSQIWMFSQNHSDFKLNILGGNLGGLANLNAATQFEFWLDDQSVNSDTYGITGSAHEFGHALGIPHPWDLPANVNKEKSFGNVSGSLMGYLPLKELDDNYIRDDVKKEMGLTN